MKNHCNKSVTYRIVEMQTKNPYPPEQGQFSKGVSMKHYTNNNLAKLLNSVYGINAVSVSVITDDDIDRMYEEDCNKKYDMSHKGNDWMNEALNDAVDAFKDGYLEVKGIPASESEISNFVSEWMDEFHAMHD